MSAGREEARRGAVVTGGGSGIGEATALRLARGGMRVVIVGRTLKKLEAVARAIEASGGSALPIAADLRDPAQARRAMEEAGAQLEHIDLLVNSAGIYREGPFVETSNEVIDDLFDINVKALIYTIQAALAWMQPGSCIINVASMSGVRPLHNNQTMYAATKAAVIQLGACLARELVPRRIRVNTISPGPTRTPIIETVAPKERIPEIEAYLAQVVPLGRLGEPGEVADAIAHLSTMEFATGANLVLDGGVVL